MLLCIWVMKQNNWRLLADLNISIKTLSFLQSLGFDIKRIDKKFSDDQDVVNLAKNENRIILTFDKDFGEIYYFSERKTFSVIVLYLKNQTSEYVNRILERFFDEIEYEEIKNKLIILYEGRYRIVD